MANNMCSNFPEKIRSLASDLSAVDLSLIADDIKTLSLLPVSENVMNQMARICDHKNIIDPEWGLLAGRIIATYLQSTTPGTFSQSTDSLKASLDDNYYSFVSSNSKHLDKMIVPERDLTFNLFAINTLRHSYLLKIRFADDVFQVAETPQYMYLRIATYLWFPDKEKIKSTYDSLSRGEYSHASPTMFNCGLKRPQLGSCFLMHVPDNMQGISKSWHDFAIISMNSGGIGCDYSSLRHSSIGNIGQSRGVVQWLKIADVIMDTVDQCGRRKGSQTAFLCDWHVDIEDFINARKPGGSENMRARDLFYGLWVHDLFMNRVKEDGVWSLFCPNKCKGLVDKWGIEFEMLYTQYEEQKKYIRQMKARDLWLKILSIQIETGMPFICYADASNRKSNQNNLGTIRCSNLCTEILEYVSEDEIASCNLASVALGECVYTDRFNFQKLEVITRTLVRNLNQVIDRNYYPNDVPQIKFSNLKNRPIGIGVQGLADVFAKLSISWESEDARRLNYQIFECMYYSALLESMELSKRSEPYETFKGSPLSKGILQFDMWDQESISKVYKGESNINPVEFSSKQAQSSSIHEKYSRIPKEDWDSLRKNIIKYGTKNSLLLALMPTASSAQILGNNESMEPYTSNIYMRSVLAGQYYVLNRYLIKALKEIDQWTTENVKSIILHNGSIQHLTSDNKEIDQKLDALKPVFKTAFEIGQKELLQLMLDRGRFICQTQSHNCFMDRPTQTKLNAYHFYGWERGAKTGMYYLRQQAKTSAINHAVSSISIPERKKKKWVCTEEVCTSCST